MFWFIKKFVSLHRKTEMQCLIGLWCNGNTTDSGPVIPGSNPGSPTKLSDFFLIKAFWKLCFQEAFFMLLSFLCLFPTYGTVCLAQSEIPVHLLNYQVSIVKVKRIV